MSKTKSVCIESTVGKREVKLLLYFSTGKIKALQLNNNIKSVILRTYGDNQNYLHLTFKNNDFLFVEKLNTTDARQLKRFLDKVYQKNLRASKRNDEETSGGPSTSTEELGGSSSLEVHSEAGSKCLESAKESEVPLPSSSPATLSSMELFGKQLIKRKRSLPDSEKKGKENIPKDSSRECEAKSVVPVHDDKGKERDLGEAEMSKPGFGFSFETNYSEESDSDIHNLHDLIRKFFSPFLLEPHCVQKGVEWHECMKTLLLYPEKAWQGLPNVGNTCYINVVLQSLCSVPLFVNDLFNQGFPWIKPPTDDFNMRLMQLLVLKDIYNTKTRENLLISITKALPELADAFIADTQNDAHEFLSLCLVQLKETVQKLTVLWQSESESGGNSLLRRIFAGHAIVNKIPVCPVANNFEFELLRSIFCKGCGLAVFNKEQSSYLSINIPQGLKGQNLSIQSSFDLFFKAEELEHRCERCMHNRSIALHKFGSLPRVIILHLKRYSFKSQVMKKDEQHIIISKYLKLSFHCNRNTKLPQPLSQNAHVKDLDLLKPLQELGSEILEFSFNSLRASRFKDFTTGDTRSDNESEAQNVKIVSKVLSGKGQQEDQRYGDTANVIGSELTNETGNLKKHKKVDLLRKLDSGRISEATEESDIRIPERSPKYQQAQKCSEERRDKQTSGEAVAQKHPKPRSREQIESTRKPAEAHTQNGKLKSQGSLDSSRNPGNKDGLGKKRKSKVKVSDKEENAYRLFNIISHIGSSPQGGHYINDAFDFRKQDWFTYSDPQVTSTQEDLVCKARLSTGYVFFYMHNEIFEELLARETRSRKMSQK
ncbi:Ubiquitin carboxyl-terminal hydrolase 26 [Cricetulus griseus]|nr:Ubiquitin carboxyl-terminal hydrolase 26 [Cricetulus griseus]ERE65210.1 ubiquitin carboxyl-terminal hydrolase 26-like protein [Cricetulus griseus]